MRLTLILFNFLWPKRGVPAQIPSFCVAPIQNENLIRCLNIQSALSLLKPKGSLQFEFDKEPGHAVHAC